MQIEQEIGVQWVTDLLSGEYEQARHAFVDIGAYGHLTYCCLAVLCKQAEKVGLVRFEDEVLYIPPCREGHSVGTHDEECVFLPGAPFSEWDEYDNGDLPEIVTQWAGVSGHDPDLIPDGIGAIGANDSRGFTFEQIAHIITTGTMP